MNISKNLNALDLLGEKVTAEDIVKAKAILQAAYGKDFDKEKFGLFFELIQEDNWSNVRLQNAIKNLIKTNKYANWNIADLYNYGQKLHGYSWYLDQIDKNPAANNDIVCYRIDGRAFFCKKDDVIVDLPFQKVELTNNLTKKQTKDVDGVMNDEHIKNLADKFKI